MQVHLLDIRSGSHEVKPAARTMTGTNCGQRVTPLTVKIYNATYMKFVPKYAHQSDICAKCALVHTQIFDQETYALELN